MVYLSADAEHIVGARLIPCNGIVGSSCFNVIQKDMAVGIKFFYTILSCILLPEIIRSRRKRCINEGDDSITADESKLMVKSLCTFRSISRCI